MLWRRLTKKLHIIGITNNSGLKLWLRDGLQQKDVAAHCTMVPLSTRSCKNIYWETTRKYIRDAKYHISNLNKKHSCKITQASCGNFPTWTNQWRHPLWSQVPPHLLLIVTALLTAASLAAGVISPTLASKHIAWALTALMESNRRYCPTIKPSKCSYSWRPVALVSWHSILVKTVSVSRFFGTPCRKV